MELKKIRGVRDILPEDTEKIRYIVNKFSDISKKFLFREVLLPTIEYFQLYNHTLGETTEIVNKQMFEIALRSEEDQEKMVLRPEGTAGMLRVFLENNLRDKYPLKRFFYFGPMFRYERPQKGRYREFYQFGLEIFGEPAVGSDFLIIFLINNMLNAIGIKYELEINSIGCVNCRKNFISYLKEYLNEIRDNLCDLCKKRLDSNPLRILDCKSDSKLFSEKEINIQKFLCDNCKRDFDSTIKLLDEMKIKYKIVPTLVRGLDYYNGFVFEYKTELLNAAQNTICAGGRYDELIKRYDKQTGFACGAAFGIDRILEIFKYNNDKKQQNIKIGIATVNDDFFVTAVKILEQIVSCYNLILIGPFYKKSFKSQLRMFNNEKCKYVIIVGEETKNNKVVIKNFQANVQQEVEVDRLINFINSDSDN